MLDENEETAHKTQRIGAEPRSKKPRQILLCSQCDFGEGHWMPSSTACLQPLSNYNQQTQIKTASAPHVPLLAGLYRGSFAARMGTNRARQRSEQRRSLVQNPPGNAQCF